MKRLILEPGKEPVYVDMTAAELTQRQTEETKRAADDAKPKQPSVPEMVEAMMRHFEGDDTQLNDIKARRAALSGP